jgi:hypothetical protein
VVNVPAAHMVENDPLQMYPGVQFLQADAEVIPDPVE